MHYLNNASTSWPKPEVVYKTLDASFRHMFSPKRGTSSASRQGGMQIDDARGVIAKLLNATDCSRIYFTAGCTHALNLVIQGLPWEKGDGIIISAIEHHAISRPVRKMAREKGIVFHVVPYTDDHPFDIEAYESILTAHKNIKLVATVHASNVIGCILPIQEIGRIAKQHNVPYLVDAAQTAGSLPIDVQAMNIDILAVPGHKSLYGPPGIGAVYISDQIELNTFMEGGTGGDSGKHPMTPGSAGYFEVGTIPLFLIQTFSCAVNWLINEGIDKIRAQEVKHLSELLSGLKALPTIEIYGHTRINEKTPVVSFNVKNCNPQEMGNLLNDKYEIALRAGFHCAPMAHEAIGTIAKGGAIRASIGYFTQSKDIDALLNALAEITR